MTTEPGKVLVIDGSAIDDIASFYRELNHVFMQGEEWTLGQSLDALNDLLYGGYGAIDGREPVTLRWQASAHSRQALGVDATARFYQHKLLSPQHYNVEQIERALATLEAGTGSTYFDLVLEIIAEHPNITLLLE